MSCIQIEVIHLPPTLKFLFVKGLNVVTKFIYDIWKENLVRISLNI